MTTRNSKKARRWRLNYSTQFRTDYALDCTASDRIAIVSGTSPYIWGIYGWPNPNGVPHQTGREETFLGAKQVARAALDAMIGPEI